MGVQSVKQLQTTLVASVNEMTITPLIMYLFKIRQMQKIEQVMPDLSVILPAPQNLLFNYQKHDLLKDL